jgi:CBS domain-containing protein
MDEDSKLTYQSKIERLFNAIDKTIPDFRKNSIRTLLAMYHSIKYHDLHEDVRNAKKIEARAELLDCTNRDFARYFIDDSLYLDCFIKYLQKFEDGEECKNLCLTLLEYQKQVMRNLAGSWATDKSDYRIVEKSQTVEDAKKLLKGSIRILIILEDVKNLQSSLLGVLTETDLHKSKKSTDTLETIMTKSVIHVTETDPMEKVYTLLWISNPKEIEHMIVLETNKTFMGVITKREANRWKMGEFPDDED